MRRVLLTIGVPIVFALIGWVGGYDFNTRGFGPAYSLAWCFIAMFIVWNITKND